MTLIFKTLPPGDTDQRCDFTLLSSKNLLKIHACIIEKKGVKSLSNLSNFQVEVGCFISPPADAPPPSSRVSAGAAAVCPGVYETTAPPMGLGKRKLTYPIQRSCVSFASDTLLHSLPPHTRTTNSNSWPRVGTVNQISTVSYFFWFCLFAEIKWFCVAYISLPWFILFASKKKADDSTLQDA